MSKYLEEKKNDLIVRAEKVLEQVKAEKRELTDAEKEELAEIRDDVRRIKETLKMDDDFRELKEMEKVEDNEPKEESEMAGSDRACEEQKRSTEEMELRAFEAYVRGQAFNERYNMEKGNNGAVIPTTIANRIIKRVYDIAPVLQRSEKYNIKGQLDLPYYDETSHAINVAYQSEFSSMTASSGDFTTISLTGYLCGALTKISRSLINNAQFNIVDFVVDHMAYAIARFIEGQLLNGFQSPLTAGVTGLSNLSNKIVAGSASAITADEVIKLHDAIKDQYQQDAIWVMSPATRTALRLLKATTGEYLLNGDITSPFGSTLLGKPVYVSDNMSDIQTKKTVIYYGDMKGLATKFSEDINIQVLREKYADEHADGVIGWFEFDAKVIDAQKIARLEMA